jgi:hypothetical protein
MTVDDIDRIRGWLVRYVKPQDRRDIERLCEAAMLGVLSEIPDARGEAEQPPPSDALEFIEESRLHKLERDAERYRWIRMNRKGALISIWIGHKDGPKDFDAAIDTCVLSSRSLQQEEKP